MPGCRWPKDGLGIMLGCRPSCGEWTKAIMRPQHDTEAGRLSSQGMNAAEASSRSPRQVEATAAGGPNTKQQQR